MKFLTLLTALFMMSFMLQLSSAGAALPDASTITNVNGASGNSWPKDPNCPTGNCAKNMPDPNACGFNCPTKLMPDGTAEERVKEATKKDTSK
jgi:hypothetical protein